MVVALAEVPLLDGETCIALDVGAIVGPLLDGPYSVNSAALKNLLRNVSSR